MLTYIICQRTRFFRVCIQRARDERERRAAERAKIEDAARVRRLSAREEALC